MNMANTSYPTLAGRFVASALIVFALLLGVNEAGAQNVTVRATNGSMVASIPEGISGYNLEYDTYFKLGGFATWRHEQLSLSLTASDEITLTDNGQLKNPANNIYADTPNDVLQVGTRKWIYNLYGILFAERLPLHGLCH